MALTATPHPAPLGVEEIRQPPAGIVKPPRDIQAIVEKTAGYVSRNGPVFEDRIREKEKHNPKFSFLSPNDPYAPFYTWRLQEVREGRGTAISAGRVGEAAPAQEPEKPKGPARPPDFQFSARMPNINAQDLDVVKLTALFVAKNGRSFMTTLVQRETRNFQFDFLRPQHSLHQFFSRLVDQYSLLLQSSSAEAEKAKRARMYELELHANDRFSILGRAKQRAEWAKFQEEQKQKKQEAAEKEQLEYAQIDWHDFVVVETVLFEEADEQADLPPPTSLNDLQSASLEQKAAMSLQPHDRRIEEAMPTTQDYSLFYNQQQPSQQPYAIPAPPIIPHEQQQQVRRTDYQPEAATHAPIHNSEEERAIADRVYTREQAQAAQAAAKGAAGQPLRIREDYVPRAQAKRQNVQTALCPNCKQPIPYDELEHHMKIELLDPRWKEQRLKAEARATTTNLSTSDVAANLKRLASQRSDVFEGVTGQPAITAEEEARRKRVAMTGGYDGQIDGLVGSVAAKKAMAQADAERNVERERGEKMKGGSIEEQIRLIHQKARS
ncbi:MAG: hypothetical protein Q9163_004752 [Psora crenata]